MHIIYHDVGGAHSVAVAAALHLNKLPVNNIPTKEDIISLATFDKIKKKDIGHLIYQGKDEFANQVYTLGYKYSSKIALPLLQDTYALLGKKDDLLLIDTKPTINFLMKVGGFTSRGLGISSLGRPIVTRGVLKAYPKLVELVSNVKRNLKAKKS
ncbi:DUF3189 family protein [Orenia marismortui]|uniref:DUF3189 family protein n=1 Tax=Orenia marismortui TaxID=46469 RepID=UPI00035F357C|nr:DUF3189 family protein [Orenia marismortui]